MSKKNEMSESELEHALAAAESGSAGQLLRTIREESEPRAAFVQQLERRLKQQATPAPRFKPLLLVGASLALLILLGGLFWLNQPEAVSAQQVLDRAAAPQLAPNQIVHRIYKLEQASGKPATGSGDVWVQANASGVIVHTAMTFTSYAADGSVLNVQRIVLNEDNVQQYTYDPRDNSVHVQSGTFDQVMGDQPNYFDGASVAKYLTKVAHGDAEGVKLLPPQIYNGVRVQVIGMKEDRTKFYFDAQSYILQGIEGPGMRVWLAQTETVTQKDLPPDAFAFNLPPNARMVQDDPKSKSQDGARIEIQTLLKACNLEQATLDAGTKAGHSPLTICQASRPNMTQAQLVAAFMAPIKAQWDAEVAAGKMTAAQEAEDMTNVQKKLGFWVTSPLADGAK